MRFLNPAWFWIGLLALPILVLYMLKLRRREVPVSSILLWEMLLRDRQANAPWQRLRRNLLLFLQLLILAALVMGLARPALRTSSMAIGSAVILLDASASMSATDVQPSRFEAAREAARGMIAGLESGKRMTLILVGLQPEVLISAESDRVALRRALDSIPAEKAPTQGAVNWPAAFALAAGALSTQNGSGEQASILILSDGGLPAGDLPPLPGQVRYVPLGESGENLALTALALRPAAGGIELFAQVTNYGAQTRQAVLSFYLDDVLFSAEPVEVQPGERRSFTRSGLPGGTVLYQAQLSSPDPDAGSLDPFSLDDTAFAIHRPARGGRALLLGPGNLFLEQLLAALPGITPFRAVPDKDGAIQIPEEPFDLYILDGLAPDPLPDGDILFINPPPNPLFEVTGVFSDTGETQVADHPLAQWVDWSGVHVRQSRLVQMPSWGEVLVETENGPLVFAGETGRRRVAVVTFDLHDSDLPLQVTFPILFSNLLEYLAPSGSLEAAQGLQPGDPVRINSPATETESGPVRIASPGGKVYALQPGENGVMFTQTDELGVYAVNYFSQGDSQEARRVDFFAVNLFDERESSIAPAQTIQIGRSAIPPAVPAGQGQREIWPWLVAAALCVLMLEWLVYHRRLSLSAKKS